MLAMRRSPFLRIALLSLAVLFAHTARANTLPTIPLAPPCPGKVAAAQPDPEKKLTDRTRAVVSPGHPVDHRSLADGSFSFTAAQAASLLSAHSAGQITLARWAVDIAPQHRPFALRI